MGKALKHTFNAAAALSGSFMIASSAFTLYWAENMHDYASAGIGLALGATLFIAGYARAFGGRQSSGILRHAFSAVACLGGGAAATVAATLGAMVTGILHGADHETIREGLSHLRA